MSQEHHSIEKPSVLIKLGQDLRAARIMLKVKLGLLPGGKKIPSARVDLIPALVL